MWGYMLLGRGRPEALAQVSVMYTFNIETGRIWSDTITKGQRGRGGGQRQLVHRNRLLSTLAAGDTVVVPAAYGLGVGATDAGWFLDQLASKKVSLIIGEGALSVDPAEDRAMILKEVKRAQNRTNVAAWAERQKDRHNGAG
tara:strand:+ start:21753 stop:22178 length:426 start_codon:yes stop_codon:yes gene_type:complete